MKRKTETSCPVEGPGRGIETGQRGEKCAVAHGLRPTLGRLMCVFCALKNGQKMALWGGLRRNNPSCPFFKSFRISEGMTG